MSTDAPPILARPRVVAGEARVDGHRAGHRPAPPDGWLLLRTIAGCGRVRSASSTTVDLDAGDLLLVRPDAAPAVYESVDGAWRIGWLGFVPRDEWIAWLDAWPTVAAGLARRTIDVASEIGRTIVAALADAHDRSMSRHAHRPALATNALERALLACCAADDAAPPPVDDRMHAVADWMCRNLDRPVTLDALSVLAGLSVSGLSHRFRAEVGAPPLQFLERQRMQRARELLAMTGLPARDVARDVGYEDVAYFAARFRKANSCSPEEYRRQFARSDDAARTG